MSSLSPAHSIFAPIVALSFSAHQAQDCADFLVRRNENFEVVPISDEAQLLLRGDGRLVENNYRFNAISFAAVCQAISGGLGRVFGEISGETPSKLAYADLWSVPAAVSIYNTALRVRFEALRERSLLVDHNAKVVDGFIGLNHKFLDNATFFTIIREQVARERPAAKFHRAELIGRELHLYYIDPTTRRTDIHENSSHSFAAGWYFCNREDSGNSIRTIPCLYTKFGLALLPDNRKYRLVHVGADLVGKTEGAVSRALTYEFDMPALRQRVQELVAQPLGFTDNKPEFDAAVAKWTTVLFQRGINKPDNELIVKNAAMVGSDLTPANPLVAYSREILTRRTVYDLVCAICRYARNQPTTEREKFQAVAMTFLVPEKGRNR